jgi:hypothetical protein
MNTLHAVPLNTNILETLAFDWCTLGFQSFRRHSSNATYNAGKPKCIYTGYIIKTQIKVKKTIPVTGRGGP